MQALDPTPQVQAAVKQIERDRDRAKLERDLALRRVRELSDSNREITTRLEALEQVRPPETFVARLVRRLRGS